MEVVTITKDNFQAEVLGADKPVLVDFWAAWCGPCKMMAPVIEEVAAAHDDVIVAKLNIDDNQELARQYAVMSIPTLMVFEKGQVKETSVGLIGKDEVEKLLK